MPVLIVILIISFLVVIHELGHLFAALKNGVSVEEFGFGYPPRLIKILVWRGVAFTLNLIPFGGFVRMEGEHGSELDAELEKRDSTKTVKTKSFGKPFYFLSSSQRLSVILAGVFANLLFALVSFSVVFSAIGIPTMLENQARIGQIAPNSPAQEAGLPVNVNIVEIRSKTRVYQITNIAQVQQAVSENKGEMLEFQATEPCKGVSCPDRFQTYQIYVRTEEETPEGQGSIGVGFEEVIFQFYPWYEMPFRGSWYGLRQAVELGYMILMALIQMLVRLFTTGTVPQDVAGPVGIVYEAQQGNIISKDFWSNLGFAGMLSLNLAIINLLPIPALDGGRAIFILLEKILGKERVQNVERVANYGGFIVLIILIVAITIKDIGKIVGW